MEWIMDRKFNLALHNSHWVGGNKTTDGILSELRHFGVDYVAHAGQANYSGFFGQLLGKCKLSPEHSRTCVAYSSARISSINRN